MSIPHLSLKSPCRICTQSPGSRFLGCSPRDFGGRHTDLLPPIAFVSLPGLRAGPAVRQRDVLCCQPLAPGSADVHPPGAAGGRVPPFQPQGTGGGEVHGWGKRGSSETLGQALAWLLQGTELHMWEKNSTNALGWRGGWDGFGMRLEAALWGFPGWRDAAAFIL